jgi:hypothetical protein
MIGDIVISVHFALMLAGYVFGFVALVNLSRLIFKFNITLGKKRIPLWFNAIGFIVATSLSAAMFMAGG